MNLSSWCKKNKGSILNLKFDETELTMVWRIIVIQKDYQFLLRKIEIRK